MTQPMGTALVPALRRFAARVEDRRKGASGGRDQSSDSDFNLVRRRTTLQDTEKVVKHLPDILGRALARAWIDPAFSAAMLGDPVGLLADHQVFLPSNIHIEIETTESQRQRIVVYERGLDGRDRRLLYLQLVMMAGK